MSPNLIEVLEIPAKHSILCLSIVAFSMFGNDPLTTDFSNCFNASVLFP